MHALFFGLLAVIHLSTLAGAHKSVPRSRHRDVSRRATAANSSYVIKDLYQGQNFFDDWYFYTDPDPTNGNVNFQSEQSAMAQGLAYVNAQGSAVLAVDSKSAVPVGGNRNSVRITSKKSYTGGLFILDAAAMPVGCGTWPAFWTTGPNWPMAGEIDIVEGVNNAPTNQMTLHSGSPGCSLTPSSSTNAKFSGNTDSTNCLSSQSSNGGCAVTDPSTSSFGYGFNGAGGGVFAMLWDTASGISIWHFPRCSIPQDITNKAPTPSTWGTPVGLWSSQGCNIAADFYQHSIIFDTTICGDWAGGAYGQSGCPGTCSQIVANASNFANAQWVINYVAVYQSQ